MAKGGAQSMAYGYNKTLAYLGTKSIAQNESQSITYGGDNRMAHSVHSKNIAPDHSLGFFKGSSAKGIKQLDAVRNRVHNQVDLNCNVNRGSITDDPFFDSYMTN